jgi:hypothetical protein
MGDWISDLLIFSAGIAGGVLISMIVSSLDLHKRRGGALGGARKLILADMKQQHDKEILHAAFRTTEDIRGELNQSLSTLRKTLMTMTVLDPVPEPPDEQRNPVSQTSEPVKSN